MEFTFDANQEYQIRAIEAVMDLLEGQPRVDTGLPFTYDTGMLTVANRLDLMDDVLLTNLQTVQARNSIMPDDALQWITEDVETVDGALPVRFPNFTVEMETGTGKTYVYLRTALELYRRYGLRKFIVVWSEPPI